MISTEVKIENIFSTPIYISKIEIENLNFDGFKMVKAGRTANHVYASEDQQVLKKAKFKKLKNEIDQHMRHFYYNVLQYADNTYPEMSTSWMVQSSQNEQSDWHEHFNSIFSGVFYLNVPNNSGNITFSLTSYDDRKLIRVLNPEIQTENPYNTRLYSVTPQDNTVIIFPSSLRHKVERNCSNQKRVSIAFNYFIKGDFLSHTANLSI